MKLMAQHFPRISQDFTRRLEEAINLLGGVNPSELESSNMAYLTLERRVDNSAKITAHVDYMHLLQLSVIISPMFFCVAVLVFITETQRETSEEKT